MVPSPSLSPPSLIPHSLSFLRLKHLTFQNAPKTLAAFQGLAKTGPQERSHIFSTYGLWQAPALAPVLEESKCFVSCFVLNEYKNYPPMQQSVCRSSLLHDLDSQTKLASGSPKFIKRLQSGHAGGRQSGFETAMTARAVGILTVQSPTRMTVLKTVLVLSRTHRILTVQISLSSCGPISSVPSDKNQILRLLQRN